MSLSPSAGATALTPARVRFDVFPIAAALYLGYVFIGTHPLADVSVADRLEGSPLDRLYVMGMFAGALVVLWTRRDEFWTQLVANPGVLAVSAIIVLSALWSSYPDLTIRRVAVYLFLVVAGAAVALSAGDARRLHGALFAAFALVVAINLAATAASPGTAITEIGVRGIYTQKNVAGSVAMMGFVVGAFWIAGARSVRSRLLGALGLALIFAFLVVTKSKTSLGLALVAPALGAALWFAARFGRVSALIAVAGLLLVVVLGFAAFAVSGFDVDRALDLLIGDSSFTGRDELWAFARNEIGKRPWLGHGYGGFWDVGLANDPIGKLEPGTWLGDTDVGVINQAHNGYLDLALNVGVPATVLAGLTIFAAMLREIGRAHAGAADSRSRAAHGAFAALLFAYLLHNTTEATLFLRGAPFWNLIVVVLFAPPCRRT